MTLGTLLAVLCSLSTPVDGPLDVLYEGSLPIPVPKSGSQFGDSVALWGERAVVGAPREATVPGLLNGGAAYVYVRAGRQWELEQKLVVTDVASSANFGTAVAIEGDRVVVGASTDDVAGVSNAGSAYVFVRSGTDWVLEDELPNPAPEFGDEYGGDVAISGDTVFVGAAWDTAGSGLGTVTVFERTGSAWVQVDKLTPSMPGGSSLFGDSLCLDGDTALIGAPAYNPFGFPLSGAAYVFERVGGAWVETVRLTPADAAAQQRFGSDVALRGNRALIGAGSDDLSGEFTNEGSAYVFERVGAVWAEVAKLVASDGVPQDAFGETVAFEGDTALIGAKDSGLPGSSSNTGSVYLFAYDGAQWGEVLRMTSPDPGPNEFFGSSLAVENGRLSIGARGDKPPASTDSGAAYLYQVVDCTAAVPGAQVARAGDPPNPLTLPPDPVGAPVLGQVWSTAIDHTAFAPGAVRDLLLLGTLPINLATPIGTLLLDPAQAVTVTAAPPGAPLVVTVPSDCSLLGQALVVQGLSIEAPGFALTNALDLVIGNL